MLITIILWLYILLLLYMYGFEALLWLRRILKIDTGEIVDQPLTLFMGLIVITFLAMIGNLFMPLGIFFVSILSVGALIITFWRWRSIPVSFPTYGRWVGVVLILVFITILENATHIPSNSDTGLYHAQTIRWFETYRIVPGLGNLQMRYAFNSSWLVLNSALSFAFLGSRSFRLMNGVIFLSAMCYFANGLQALTHNRISVSNLMKIFFLPLSFYLLGSEISSVGNDMPVTLVIWLVLLLWVEKIESSSESRLKSTVLILLCFFAVIIKLSSLPLLFFALFIVVEYLAKKDWQSAFVFTTMGGLIFLPWMIRSIILSGYPVFPQSQIDLFSVDWKMPGEQVELAVQGIIGLARIGNSWRPSMDLFFWQWAPRWFDKLTLNRQAILLFVLFSPLFLLVGRYRYPSVVSSKYIIAFSSVFIGSVLWFVSAPDIRFGYGFLIATCMLALMPFAFALFVGPEKISRFIPKLTLTFLFVFQLYILLKSFEATTFSQRWLLPADYPSSTAQMCGINGAEIYCRGPGEQWTQCYYDLFPCIPSHFPKVQMRGPTFQDGFRSNSNPEP